MGLLNITAIDMVRMVKFVRQNPPDIAKHAYTTREQCRDIVFMIGDECAGVAQVICDIRGPYCKKSWNRRNQLQSIDATKKFDSHVIFSETYIPGTFILLREFNGLWLPGLKESDLR